MSYSPTLPDSSRAAERTRRRETTHDLLEEAAHLSGDARDHVLEEVVLVNRGVAQAVASRFRGRGVPDDDLEQTAYVGLTKAVHRFDPEAADDLLTFAVPTIRGELQRYFRDQSWTVRPPRRIQELQWRGRRSEEELHQRLGHEPTASEVADDLDVTPQEYGAAMAAQGCFHPTSLDAPYGEGATSTLGDHLVDHATDPTDTADGHLGDQERVEQRAVVRPLLRGLPPRERRLLQLWFGEQLSQGEIGDELGVSQAHVSRLLRRTLDDLRQRAGATPTH